MSDKHGVPALLSFLIPGLGQLVKGHVGRGIGIGLAALITAALSIVGIGLILYPIVWVYGIYDAYNK